MEGTKNSKIAKMILKRDLILSDIKTYKGIVVKTVLY